MPLLSMGMGLAGLIMGTTLAMAQDPLQLPTVEPPPDPPELQHLRQQTMVQAISAASVLTDQYIKALANLENEAAAKGEYEQALAAQTRRRNLNEVQAQRRTLATLEARIAELEKTPLYTPPAEVAR